MVTQMQISKVLVIDDDSVVGRIIQLTLTKVAGWDVIVAANGPEAMLMLAGHDLPRGHFAGRGHATNERPHGSSIYQTQL